jgi:hypothetical protein
MIQARWTVHQVGSIMRQRALFMVGSWLRSLGLERYEAAFRDNEITEKVLPRLTAED